MEGINRAGKTHPERGWHHFMGESLDQMPRRKLNTDDSLQYSVLDDNCSRATLPRHLLLWLPCLSRLSACLSHLCYLYYSIPAVGNRTKKCGKVNGRQRV